MGKIISVSLEDRMELFRLAWGFQGLNDHEIAEIAEMALVRGFDKGEIIYDLDEPCKFFYVVASGLIKVSISSFSGTKITYLLAGRGEPLNLVGPFTGAARILSAEALKNSAVACVKREEFVSFAFKYPQVVTSIISILGNAIDSANSRILDMMEKRVELRIVKVLYSLYKKFGDTLHFTSTEIAELAGTTTESTLRAMGRLREIGTIGSSRGEICILKPSQLECLTNETLWV
jgi:CRP-like cAMP-binding protein